VQYAARYVINTVPYGVIYKAWRDQPANVSFHFLPMTTKGTEATLGLRPISSVTLYRIAQYKIPLAFNALYFPYSETTHLFGVNSTD
jgi:hypothetical protein